MDAKEALEAEAVLFSKLVKKVNRRGASQARALVVTSLAVYNLKPGVLSRWQRRIGLHELEEVVACPGSAGKWLLLLHMWPVSEEYDYLLEFETESDRTAATAAISSGFKGLVGRPLSELKLPPEELQKRQVQKTEARARAKAADDSARRAKESRASVVRTNMASRKSITLPTASAAAAAAGSKPKGILSPNAGPDASPPTETGEAGSAGKAEGAAADPQGSMLSAGRVQGGLAGTNDRAGWDSRASALTAVALACVDAVAAKAREGDSRALPALTKAEADHGRATELGGAKLVAEAILHPQAASTVHWWLRNMATDASSLLEAAAALSVRPFRPRPVFPKAEEAAAGEDDDEFEYEDEDDAAADGAAAAAAAGGAGAGMPSPAGTHEESAEARGWWLRVMWDLHTRALEGGAAQAKGKRGDGADSAALYRETAEAVGRFHEALPALFAAPFPASVPFVVGMRAELGRRAGIGSGGRDEARGFAMRSAGAAAGTPGSAAMVEQAAARPWVRDALEEDGAQAAVAAAADRVTSVPGSRTGHCFVPLEESVYLALLEIMMGQVHRPDDEDRGAETFGQLVRQAPVVSLVARLAPLAPTWAVRLRVVKDLNVLLVRKDDNFARVMAGGDWPAWLAPFLAAVPKREEDRDVRVKEYSKYVMNLYAMLLYHVMSQGGDDVEQAINKLFAQLVRQCGAWSLDVTTVARSVLSNLLVKIGSGSKRWRKDLTQPHWGGLFAVARVVEDFCFYRPEEAEQSGDTLRVATAMAEVAKVTERRRAREAPPSEVVVNAEDLQAGAQLPEGALEWRSHGVAALSKDGVVVPGLLPLLPEYVSPAAVIPLASGADGKVDRASPGLHLAEADGKPLDIKLAKRTLTLLTKLGLKGKAAGGAAASGGGSGPEKQVRRHGSGLIDAFEAVVSFFESVASKGRSAIADLPAFLEKRQREQSTGFLSRGAASRKQLAAQLDASLMRQQAQREVRKQLKAQIDKIGDAVEVDGDADIDEAALAVARRGRRRRKVKPAPAAEGAAAAAASSSAGAGAAAADGEDGPEDDLKASALRAAMGAVEGSGGEGEGGAADDDTLTDAESAVEDPDDDDVHADGSSCPVCDEGLEGRDTTRVPSFGTCHLECVACSECSRQLSVEGDPSADDVALRTGGVAMTLGGKLLCRAHFLDKFSTGICAGCLVPFRKGERAVDAAGRRWHPEHLVCESCGGPFVDGKCYGVGGLPYCGTCHLDLFLRCNGCGKGVEEADDGVNALGKTWHRSCFVCTDCGGAFPEGRFYSREGRPYCEEHYFENFAPKCARCTRPVVSDGLRACGAVWHNECFGCAVCSCSFEDGKFFEKDGQAYCEEHYLDRFGQRCGGCGLVIKDKYMQALDQSWHQDCFVCAECGSGFDGGAFFTKEGRPYCRDDFARLFCPTCPGCSGPVIDGPAVQLGDDKWHSACLTCHECGESLDGQMVVLPDPPRRFHKRCFNCDGCGTSLQDEEGKSKFAIHEGKKLCATCIAAATGRPCQGCGATIGGDEPAISALGGAWHPQCLSCLSCGNVVTGKLLGVGGRPLCGDCFEATKPQCVTCALAIDGPHKVVLGHAYHADCVVCTDCGGSVEAGAFKRNDWLVCKEHAAGAEFEGEAAERVAVYEAHAARRAKAKADVDAASAAAAAGKPAGAGAGSAAPAAPPAPGSSSLPAANKQFEAFQDDDGDFYFVDNETGESQWDTPDGFDFAAAGFDVPSKPAGDSGQPEGPDTTPADGAASDPNELWDVYADDDGDQYFVSRETGDSVWERPDGFTKQPDDE